MNTFVILAMIIWIIGIVYSIKSDNTWKAVLFSWIFIAIGSLIFGIVLIT
jgi:hypothetical protein